MTNKTLILGTFFSFAILLLLLQKLYHLLRHTKTEYFIGKLAASTTRCCFVFKTKKAITKRKSIMTTKAYTDTILSFFYCFFYQSIYLRILRFSTIPTYRTYIHIHIIHTYIYIYIYIYIYTYIYILKLKFSLGRIWRRVQATQLQMKKNIQFFLILVIYGQNANIFLACRKFKSNCNVN